MQFDEFEKEIEKELAEKIGIIDKKYIPDIIKFCDVFLRMEHVGRTYGDISVNKIYSTKIKKMFVGFLNKNYVKNGYSDSLQSLLVNIMQLDDTSDEMQMLVYDKILKELGKKKQKWKKI